MSDYLHPMTVAEAEDIQQGDGGLIWHAQVVKDDYANPKHLVPGTTQLKPRRPLPHW
jgi:hypothetical protein